MQLPLTLTLRRSRQLDILLLTMHASALAGAGLAALPLWLRVLLAAAITASAWHQMWRLSGPRRICRLTLRADGLLDLERSSGLGGEAAVLAQSTVMSWLTVLLLRRDGRREALAILADALGPDDFRALRLWLRWRAELS